MSGRRWELKRSQSRSLRALEGTARTLNSVPSVSRSHRRVLSRRTAWPIFWMKQIFRLWTPTEAVRSFRGLLLQPRREMVNSLGWQLWLRKHRYTFKGWLGRTGWQVECWVWKKERNSGRLLGCGLSSCELWCHLLSWGSMKKSLAAPSSLDFCNLLCPKSPGIFIFLSTLDPSINLLKFQGFNHHPYANNGLISSTNPNIPPLLQFAPNWLLDTCTFCWNFKLSVPCVPTRVACRLFSSCLQQPAVPGCHLQTALPAWSSVPLSGVSSASLQVAPSSLPTWYCNL